MGNPKRKRGTDTDPMNRFKSLADASGYQNDEK